MARRSPGATDSIVLTSRWMKKLSPSNRSRLRKAKSLASQIRRRASGEPMMKLAGLATNDVPLLHVCGSIDPLLGKNSTAIEGIYQELGGRISVMIKDGAGHHPHSLRDPTPIADFITQSAQPASSIP